MDVAETAQTNQQNWNVFITHLKLNSIIIISSSCSIIINN